MASSRSIVAMAVGVSLTIAPANASGELTFVTEWGEFGIGPGQLRYPRGIAIGPSGDVFVSDSGNQRVCRFTSDGQFVATFGGLGSAPGLFNGPDHLHFSPANGDLYVTDKFNHRVQRFSENGTFILTWGSFGSGSGQFAEPWGVHVDAFGDVWVTSREQSRLQKFTEAGGFLTQWGIEGTGFGQFMKPHGILTDPAGNVYVSDVVRHDIQKFDFSGEYLLQWGSFGSSPGQFLHPHHFSNDHGDIVVIDWLEHPHGGRLTGFTDTGVLTGVLVSSSQGSGELEFHTPYAMAYDGNEFWYVVDWGNHRVQKLRESAVGIEALPESASSMRILGDPMPNPSNGMVRLPLNFPSNSAGKVSIEVLDVRGNRIFARPFEVDSRRAEEFSWNGNDDQGRPVSAGVYFVGFSGAGAGEMRKLVRIR